MPRRTLALFLAGTWVFCVWASAPRAAAAARRVEPTPAREPVLVTWHELCARPGRHLDQRVRLEVQFHSRIASWNPYLTRFGPRDFRAVRAWADEQFPWRLADYESPAVRFFVRRDSARDQAFDPAQAFDRFEIVGVVREAFRGEPWIEVDLVRRLAEQITEGAVIHAGRGIELAGENQWQLAEAELVRALASPLPAQARAELERLRDLVLEGQASDKPTDVERKTR